LTREGKGRGNNANHEQRPLSDDVMEATRTLRDRSISEDALKAALTRSGFEKEYNALADWTKGVHIGCGMLLFCFFLQYLLKLIFSLDYLPLP
jgi:hypothetical protein